MRSVGAVLRPGAAQALFGCDADALAARHVALEDLWRASDVARLHERLLEGRRRTTRGQLLQQALLARCGRSARLHPAIAQAMSDLRRGAPRARQRRRQRPAVIGTCSLRFRAATGLSPKEYARIRRFRRALSSMLARGTAGRRRARCRLQRPGPPVVASSARCPASRRARIAWRNPEGGLHVAGQFPSRPDDAAR